MRRGTLFVVALALIALAGATDPIITKKTFVSGLLQLEWVSSNNEVVWALTNDGIVYKSVDAGVNWEGQNGAMPGSQTPIGPHGKKGVEHFSISHHDDGKDVYFAGGWDKHWRTRDAGHTYDTVDAKVWYDPVLNQGYRGWAPWFKHHPTRKGYLLASALDPSPDCVYGPTKKCQRDLYMSSDFGKSWTKSNEMVKQFDWGNGGIKPDVPELWHAFVGAKDKSPDRQEDLRRNSDKYLLESHSDFTSSADVHKEPQVDQFIVGRYDGKNPTQYGNTFIYAMWVDLNPDNHQIEDVGLFVSSDDGKTYTDITFEDTEPNEQIYTVVDMRSSITISIKEWEQTRSSWLWTSDASGTSYIKTLGPIRHARSSAVVDAIGVEGIEGIHFANQILDLGDIDNSIVTRVNFDNANTYSWGYLEPPTKHWDGSDIELQEGDHLHLFNRLELYETGGQVPFPMSDADAPGMIVACGNVGATLGDPFDTPNINTYLSMDAGLTWREIASGPHWAEFGNHGGVLLLAPVDMSDRLLYSLDYFNNHRDEIVFSAEQRRVVNIMTEPNNHHAMFHVIALNGQDAELYAVDLTPVFEGAECKGIGAPERPGKPDPDTDFEIWIPHNAGQDDCMLGRTVQFTRRKAGSICLNTAETEPAVEVRDCPCAEEDWECDAGFERSNGVCVLGHGAHWPEAPKVCPPDGTWAKTQGYRKVAGDSCDPVAEGAVNRGPVEFPCSPGGPIGTRGWLLLLVLGFLAAGLAAFTYIKRPDIVANLMGGDSKWGNPYEHTGPPQSLVDEDDDDDGDDGAFGKDMETGPEELAGDSLTQALTSSASPAAESTKDESKAVTESLVDLGDDSPAVPSSGGNKFGIQPM